MKGRNAINGPVINVLLKKESIIDIRAMEETVINVCSNAIRQ